jgi:hypothetical protein
MLLTKFRLSSWEAGFCRGLLGHQPTPTQESILERLRVKYNTQEIASEYETYTKRNGAHECAVK